MNVNIEQPRDIFEGDTIVFTLTVNADLTGYKARAQIIDISDTTISYANTEAGGTDEINISVTTGGLRSTIVLEVPKDDTNSLEEDCILEIEVENATTGKVTTICKNQFKLTNTDLTWITP